MPITITASSTRAILPAIITHHQLGALIDILRDYEQRRDTAMTFPVRGTIGQAPFVIDLRLCPIALAEIAACFDHDPAVIRIADEAQFEQLLVTVSQACKTGDIVMTLSSKPDGILPVLSVHRSSCVFRRSRPLIPTRSRPPYRFEAGHHSDAKPAI